MGETTSVQTVRVLVADDCELTRLSLKLALAKRRDITLVGVAANGREALDMAAANPPDAVLLDMQMPVLDGWATAARLKQMSPEIRIIAYSSATDLDDEPLRRASGIDAYFDKETSLDDVMQAIVLAGRRPNPA